MNEFRPGSVEATRLRFPVISDPTHRAIPLVTGDKREYWRDWYRRNILIAGDRYQAHLRELAKGT